MKQKFTILFDLDGTLVDTAPDLMLAHNYVMKKYGYPTKSTEDIRNLVGKGAGALIGRSIWGQAKKEFGKIEDKKIKDQMVRLACLQGNVSSTRCKNAQAKGIGHEHCLLGEFDMASAEEKRQREAGNNKRPDPCLLLNPKEGPAV